MAFDGKELLHSNPIPVRVCAEQHSYCVYRRWSSESARVATRTDTSSGKGRNARQSWGFTKWYHSHWAEPNIAKLFKALLAMGLKNIKHCWRRR